MFVSILFISPVTICQCLLTVRSKNHLVERCEWQMLLSWRRRVQVWRHGGAHLLTLCRRVASYKFWEVRIWEWSGSLQLFCYVFTNLRFPDLIVFNRIYILLFLIEFLLHLYQTLAGIKLLPVAHHAGKAKALEIKFIIAVLWKLLEPEKKLVLGGK